MCIEKYTKSTMKYVGAQKSEKGFKKKSYTFVPDTTESLLLLCMLCETSPRIFPYCLLHTVLCLSERTNIQRLWAFQPVPLVLGSVGAGLKL